jgi:RNA polymerase sigma-70 factor (ECF subfamily)
MTGTTGETDMLFTLSGADNKRTDRVLDNEPEFVVKAYSDMVYGIALSQLKNIPDAEDVFQEVFLTYFRKNKNYNDELHRKAWLIRVTLNCYKRVISYNSKHRNVPLEDCCLSCQFETPEENPIYNRVTSLPEKYKTAIYLYYFEELSAKEIAAILKTSEANIFMRLSRGRAILKEQLKGVIEL